jgi:hypothetical protein
MAVYMIGYDLHPKVGETYGELIAAIEKVGTPWWHCLDSTWLVVTDKSAVQIRDELKRHIRDDDQLLVIKYALAEHQAAWFGFQNKGNCHEWLTKNL